jgi:hypothetical protein
MGLKDIPRTVVGGYLKVARAPIDATLKLAGRGKRGEAVVDRADAAARDLAGTALGDEELRREAALRRTAADAREEAVDLREAAEEREAAAQARQAERTKAAQRRRASAAKKATERKATARTTATARKSAAASTAAQRKTTSRKAAAAKADVRDTRAKKARLAQIEGEAEALAERETALTAADEAARLQDAAERAKTARKS